MSQAKKIKTKKKKKKIKNGFVPIKKELSLVVVKPQKLAEMPKVELLKKVAKGLGIATIISIIVGYIILLVLTATAVFYVQRLNSGKIQSGVYIAGINVSSMKEDEALNALSTNITAKIPETLTLTYKENTYNIDLTNLEINYDFDKAVDEAYSIGRTKNVIKDFGEYIQLLNTTENIELDLTYNDELLNNVIQQLSEQFPDKVQEYSYRVENNTLIIVNGKKGAEVDSEQLKNLIIDNLKNQKYDELIEIPTTEVLPGPIDVQKIHDEIYVEPQDAYATENPTQIHKEVIGVDFNVEEVQNQINSDNAQSETYTVNLTYTNPNVFVRDLNIFPDVLSTFSTNYVNNPNRTTNLILASQKISGTILMPGETFSYNATVGERTVAAGYKNAAIFVNGKVEDGLAGGICQISSTLYNAVIGANLEVIERTNHSQLPSYLPGGKDATVVWGRYDFKFRNNREYPIRIDMNVSNGIANATFYGIRGTDEYSEISIESYFAGQSGIYKVYNAYKVYKQNGVEVKREFLSRDLYK